MQETNYSKNLKILHQNLKVEKREEKSTQKRNKKKLKFYCQWIIDFEGSSFAAELAILNTY